MGCPPNKINNKKDKPCYCLTYPCTIGCGHNFNIKIPNLAGRTGTLIFRNSHKTAKYPYPAKFDIFGVVMVDISRFPMGLFSPYNGTWTVEFRECSDCKPVCFDYNLDGSTREYCCINLSVDVWGQVGYCEDTCTEEALCQDIEYLVSSLQTYHENNQTYCLIGDDSVVFSSDCISSIEYKTQGTGSQLCEGSEVPIPPLAGSTGTVYNFIVHFKEIPQNTVSGEINYIVLNCPELSEPLVISQWVINQLPPVPEGHHLGATVVTWVNNLAADPAWFAQTIGFGIVLIQIDESFFNAGANPCETCLTGSTAEGINLYHSVNTGDPTIITEQDIDVLSFHENWNCDVEVGDNYCLGDLVSTGEPCESTVMVTVETVTGSILSWKQVYDNNKHNVSQIIVNDDQYLDITWSGTAFGYQPDATYYTQCNIATLGGGEPGGGGDPGGGSSGIDYNACPYQSEYWSFAGPGSTFQTQPTCGLVSIFTPINSADPNLTGGFGWNERDRATEINAADFAGVSFDVRMVNHDEPPCCTSLGATEMQLVAYSTGVTVQVINTSPTTKTVTILTGGSGTITVTTPDFDSFQEDSSTYNEITCALPSWSYISNLITFEASAGFTVAEDLYLETIFNAPNCANTISNNFKAQLIIKA
jgi:hypothetical protein